jgi:BlaI family transcriptional regulator, penicillinase repressor
MSTEIPALSRRERQIMDVLFSRGRSTAAEIGAAMPDAPSNSALRTLLRVLENKGHVQHEEVGRVYFYTPTIRLETARRSAARHLVDTFFAGSLESVVSTMLKLRRNRIEPEEAERITRMIEEAARKGR